MSQPPRSAQMREAQARATIGGEAFKGRLDIDVSGLPKNLVPTWVREECLGMYDQENISMNLERGKRPVTTAELPNYKTHRLPGAKVSETDDTLIRRGGQILMVEDKQSYAEDKAALSEAAEEALRSVARDSGAPKDGRNFQDLPDAGVSSKFERRAGKFSE